MAAILLIVFLTVPLLEIFLFLTAGEIIGFWPTLGLVILTAVVGTYLLRSQGLSALQRLQATLARQEFPGAELFDAACLLVAGLLLLTPGFFTDSVGLLLFVSPFRAWMRNLIFRRLAATGFIFTETGTFGPNGERRDDFGAAEETWEDSSAANKIIEGDYEVLTPENGKAGTAGGGNADSPSPPEKGEDKGEEKGEKSGKA